MADRSVLDETQSVDQIAMDRTKCAVFPFEIGLQCRPAGGRNDFAMNIAQGFGRAVTPVRAAAWGLFLLVAMAEASGGALGALSQDAAASGTARSLPPADSVAPTIVLQPAGGTALVGTSVVLSVRASEARQFQWFRDEQAIAGATEATLTIAAITPELAGDYFVKVGNAAGAVSSTIARVGVVQPTGNATPKTLAITTLSGVGPGCADGAGSAARFWSPEGVAVDAAGNVYVADTLNYTVRRITPDGRISTVAGKAGSRESQDGVGALARFAYPASVTIDTGSRVWIADGGLIRRIEPGGQVTTLSLPAGLFASSPCLAVDRDGSVYASNSQRHSILKISPAGVVTTLAGGSIGGADGTGEAAQFRFPEGVAVDLAGNVYVADCGNCTIRKITPAGVVTTVAGLAESGGSADGEGSAARFQVPTGIAVDGEGNIYVADAGACSIRKITPAGRVSTVAGNPFASGHQDGAGGTALFNRPVSLAAASTGEIFVADSSNNTIRKITPNGIVSTWAGMPSSGAEDGAWGTARFHGPDGIAVDSLGNVYVADQMNNTIRRVTADGIATTLAGVPDGQVGMINGAGAQARFWWPFGVAVDRRGFVYVADKMNNVIRRITPAGDVSVYAGVPFAISGGVVEVGTQNPGGSADGPADQAEFFGPAGLAIDEAGNVFVADQQNQTIRKISPDRVVTTVAGSPRVRGSVDGVGAAARFNYPTAVAVDDAGNLYVADQMNGAVRKITVNGTVTTLAGFAGDYSGDGTPSTGSGSADGVGSSARFLCPTGVAVDRSGNVFVADFQNHLVRLVRPDGSVSTVAGYRGRNGRAGLEGSNYGWNDGAGEGARFSSPHGVALDATGVLYISDRSNNMIRRAVAAELVPSVRLSIEHSVSRAAFGEDLGMTAGATVAPKTVRWRRNGREIAGANEPSLLLHDLKPADVGIYEAAGTDEAGYPLQAFTVVGAMAATKTVGSAREVASDIYVEANRNTFDQILLEGPAAAVRADFEQAQVTRISFVDLDDDIVQVELSGPGTLALFLDESSGPAVPVKYNQTTRYMKGHAGIVITGADERTNVSVFSVGRATAVNQALFREDVSYDGVADIAFIAISTTNGRFGGVRTANAVYAGAAGVVGVYAPDVAFAGPIYIGNITAFDAAVPMISCGATTEVRITGGDLFQANAQPVQVRGLTTLNFTDGGDSHGHRLLAQSNRAVLVQDGVNVTSEIVVNP